MARVSCEGFFGLGMAVIPWPESKEMILAPGQGDRSENATAVEVDEHPCAAEATLAAATPTRGETTNRGRLRRHPGTAANQQPGLRNSRGLRD